MAKKTAVKRLARRSTRIVGRLPDDRRKECASVAREVEEELRHRMKEPSPTRMAMAKLKVARMRAGMSLADVSQRAGIDRGNIARLENNVDNVQINTLVRLADALGYDVVVDLKRREGGAGA